MSQLPPGQALSFVDRVLVYVDQPWKIISIAGLAVIAIVSITAWEKRADIAEMILHSAVVPRLEVGRFAQVVKPLMTELDADVALLLSAQLVNNAGRPVAGLRRDDPNWIPPVGPRPIFTGANAETIVQVIQGNVYCLDIKPEGSQTARELAAMGIIRACLVSVPPVLDVLVGALIIGWHTARDAEAEAGAKSEIRRAANKLATW